MAKQVLGDNPFSGASEPPDPASNAAAPPTTDEGAVEAAPKKPKKAVGGAPRATGKKTATTATAKAPQKPKKATGGTSRRGAAKSAATTTAAPPKAPPKPKKPKKPGASRRAASPRRPSPEPTPADRRRRMEDLLGADATPSPTAPPPSAAGYGPSLDEPPRQDRGAFLDEFRMMDRWVRDRLHPMLLERRAPPFSVLAKWWRRLAMRDRSDVVDEFGRDPLQSQRAEPILDFLYRSYFRVDVTGLENIPSEGRGLIVANHSGTLPYDGMMLMHAVRTDHPHHREVRPLAEDFVFHFPYLGTVVNRTGGVRACPENAERLLARDRLIAVFPEGIKGVSKLYRDRYRLQRFGRGGFIKLALRTDSPIIPTAIVGAEEMYPMLARVTWMANTLGIPYLPVTPLFPWLGPLGLLPLPTKWSIHFGAPLYFNAEHGPEAADDRILVNRLSENVRSTIQEMIDGALARRRSILFG